MIKNLAFYREDGKGWTNEMYLNIRRYCGDESLEGIQDYLPNRKFIFDCGPEYSDEEEFEYFPWTAQTNHPNFKNCKQISYESVFESERSEFYEKDVTAHDLKKKPSTLKEIIQTLPVYSREWCPELQADIYMLPHGYLIRDYDTNTDTFKSTCFVAHPEINLS